MEIFYSLLPQFGEKGVLSCACCFKKEVRKNSDSFLMCLILIKCIKNITFKLPIGNYDFNDKLPLIMVGYFKQ